MFTFSRCHLQFCVVIKYEHSSSIHSTPVLPRILCFQSSDGHSEDSSSGAVMQRKSSSCSLCLTSLSFDERFVVTLILTEEFSFPRILRVIWTDDLNFTSFISYNLSHFMRTETVILLKVWNHLSDMAN